MDIEWNAIQDKWQKKWESAKTFHADDKSKKKKFYILEMFPYPSGEGLHMGHALNYVIGDIFSRFKIMNNFNVLHPMGYDSLGLPAENAAIKADIHPRKYTEDAITNFIQQQKKLGLTYDWSRMVKTSDPLYYKWDQWIFLKMFEKGLAYKKTAPVNWCSQCNTVLANEQVHNGKCWRHADTEVEIKNLSQWFLKTTDYAEELNDFSQLDQWPSLIKNLQKNWIGKSQGTEIIFEINNKPWKIFTTRPDTLLGVTFMVIAAQHSQLMDIVTDKQKKEVEKFVKKIHSVSAEALEQMDKEGVFTGSYAVHPLTNEKIPVYAGNFVLAEYGSGMVMAVPAHDQRDFEFAQRYKIPIKIVIQSEKEKLKANNMKEAYPGHGILVDSEKFSGMTSEKAIKKISKHLEKKKKGKTTINFRLRDWLISRQRYWGTPIPIINCPDCGNVPVPEKELPVELPEKVKFGKGNPLTTNKEFINVPCPKCKKEAQRETDTMDTFVNSSWYNFRYIDPHNNKEIFNVKKAAYWNPVDLYVGGKEHACMHLMYIRFYTKFLRDLGLLKCDEPVIKLFNQGMLHGKDGNKMSKSLGNVINPLESIEKYSADALRLFLVSVASADSDFNWSDKGLQSTHKFLIKVHHYFNSTAIKKSSRKTESKVHKAIKEITADIEQLRYSIAIIRLRQLMENLENEISKEHAENILKLFSVFCPHVAEELWEKLGNKPFISTSAWPSYDESKIDEALEAADTLVKDVQDDISLVLQLVKKQPKSITLFIADSWKYDFVKKLKSLLEKTHDVKEIIKELMQTPLRSHGKEITKQVPAFVKDPSKLPLFLLTQKQEQEAIETAKDQIKQKFSADIHIVKAETSKEAKAKQAMPGKPAILFQ